MFILSCALYERGEDTVLSDADFDQHCAWLLSYYDDLSPEFRARVSRENLECGTALGLTFTEQEFQEGLEWHARVRHIRSA